MDWPTCCPDQVELLQKREVEESSFEGEEEEVMVVVSKATLSLVMGLSSNRCLWMYAWQGVEA